jgi:integrase/recombinase XerD
MKVQRVRLPETGCFSWVVLDDNYMPIHPILSYLEFLHNLDRSPYTIRATAHHLKLFWEYLRDAHLDWTEVDVAQLAAFITWLRRPDPSMISLEFQDPRRTNATIDQILTAVHAFYDFQIRMKRVASNSKLEMLLFC